MSPVIRKRNVRICNICIFVHHFGYCVQKYWIDCHEMSKHSWFPEDEYQPLYRLSSFVLVLLGRLSCQISGKITFSDFWSDWHKKLIDIHFSWVINPYQLRDPLTNDLEPLWSFKFTLNWNKHSWSILDNVKINKLFSYITLFRSNIPICQYLNWKFLQTNKFPSCLHETN